MHDKSPDPPSDPPPRLRRAAALAMLSAAALLLHAVAFSGLQWTWPAPERPLPPAGVVQLRWVEPPEVPAATPPAAARVSAASDLPERLDRVDRPVAPPPKRPARATALAPVSPVAPAAPAAQALPADLQLAANTASAPASAPALAADDDPIPHYRTRPPPPLTLRYEVQRGGLSGTGDLSWRPAGDRYELKLDARVAGLAVLTQLSSGGFDAAGLAPERFTDRRLGRGATAANFQRAAAKITYSGAPAEVALRPGAQDRLSWMVQLAAIVAAEPQLARPGAKVVMQVSGSHGDAGIWAFRCVGPERLALRSGALDAIKFVREPREAYDTTVQVWLAPQQHDLPVRATQKSGPNDEGYELRLIEVVPTP